MYGLTFVFQSTIATGLFPCVIGQVNFAIQRGDLSQCYSMNFYLRDGVRYVVVGYIHENLFHRAVVACGVSDGGEEVELCDALCDWFRSVPVEFDVQLPISISSDGRAGGVENFVVRLCAAMDRPVLQFTIFDDRWLRDVLSLAFGSYETPWAVFEKLRIVAGGVCRNDLLRSLPILSKVCITCDPLQEICAVLFFR